ncbi:MAG: hypothetical protein KatS3mg062_0305 [Tepidiforma sp.]|nr:MAG: hypothetical protein KatS3mg062_0305 [Tepidiforma sp.]
MNDPAGQLEASGSCVRLTPEGPGRLAIIRAADDACVGHLTVRLGDLPGELLVWELCINDGERGYGCGSEAALLLVQAAVKAGWARMRARAHPRYGLSVYFWVRMGFRPLHGEGPEGGIWFVRDLRS